jgi:hypothetical protein
LQKGRLPTANAHEIYLPSLPFCCMVLKSWIVIRPCTWRNEGSTQLAVNDLSTAANLMKEEMGRACVDSFGSLRRGTNVGQCFHHHCCFYFTMVLVVNAFVWLI